MNNSKGKIIAISSVKGGVGKTTTTINLAGIYYLNGKKVLIIDLDLYAGGVATCLNIDTKKDIYTLTDSISNNRFTDLKDYVTIYNNGIDVLPCPKDPRVANKIESKYISKILDLAVKDYDIVLVDMHHILDEVSLVALDTADICFYIITNDLVDIKNMKNILTIFNENEKTNYKIILNNSRDTGRDYISLFDIRNMIKSNIDYHISKSFYIKNIDKYILKGEILTLNKMINKLHSKDIEVIKKIASSVYEKKEVTRNGE